MKVNRQRLWWMAWFTFTRRERNGVLTLSVILFVLQSFLVYRHFIQPDIRPAIINKREFNAFNSAETGKNRSEKEMKHNSKSLPVLNSHIDPNTFDEAEWIRQGLSPGQAAVVMRWRSSGRVFRKKEDVQQMKFIPPRVYANLAPWISIQAVKDFPSAMQKTFSRDLKKSIDLNTADTVLLCDLPFIGPGRARTIWKFRERLGGFYSVDQLKEVKTLPDSVFVIIRPKVEVLSPVYRKIDLNTLNDSLYHPYFNRSLVRMIIAYRTQNGFYKDPTDIRKLPLVDEDLWRKIAPYIFTSSQTQKP